MLSEIIDRTFSEQLHSLGELIAIPSVSRGEAEPGIPLGRDVNDALEYTLALARKLGFAQARSLDGFCGVVDYGEGEETLMIMTHLDVVPAGPAWTSDPFVLTERGGRLLGRGVIDDKGPAVSSLYALHAVKEAGLPLRRKVRLFFGCDEERGWSCIERFKQTEPEPTLAFTPDGAYPVINSEMGICQSTYTKKLSGSGVRIVCGAAANVIPGEAEAELPFTPEPVSAKSGFVLSGAGNTLRAVGRGGHASRPHDAKNALLQLLDALKEQPLDAEDLAVASSLAALFGFDMHGEAFGLDISDASGRLTLSPDMLSWSADEVSVTLDCRHPFGITAERLIETLDRIFSQIGFTRTYLHAKPGHFIAEDSELVRTLLEVYEAAVGHKAKALSIGGGTYARGFDNAVAFGAELEGEVAECHMPDESVSIESVRFNTLLMAEAIRRLAGE